jgi:hypothetical protein
MVSSTIDDDAVLDDASDFDTALFFPLYFVAPAGILAFGAESTGGLGRA